MSASDSRLEAAEQYVFGDRVLWRRLAGTAIGGFILAWASGVIATVGAWFDGVARLVAGPLAYIREALVLLFTIPIAGLRGGWSAAREELLATSLGPVAFVGGVVIVVAWFWLLAVLFDRLEVFG